MVDYAGGEFPNEGKATRVESKHRASQHYAGDVVKGPWSLSGSDKTRMTAPTWSGEKTPKSFKPITTFPSDLESPSMRKLPGVDD